MCTQQSSAPKFAAQFSKVMHLLIIQYFTIRLNVDVFHFVDYPSKSESSSRSVLCNGQQGRIILNAKCGETGTGHCNPI